MKQYDNVNVITGLRELVHTLYVGAGDESVSLDDRIHNTRTGLKRCRAQLRLLDYVLPHGIYRFENVHFRDLGRLLASCRDSYILVESIDYLVEQDPYIHEHSVSSIRDHLLNEYHVHVAAFAAQQGMQQVRKGLLTSYSRIGEWQYEESRGQVLDGMDSIYDKARELMQKAVVGFDDVLMHEWRKQVKYLWYQAEVFIDSGSGPGYVLAENLHELSGWLGLGHDLYELDKAIIAMHGVEIDKEKAMLQNILTDEKKKLYDLAKIAGEGLFGMAPGVFRDHFQDILKR